VKLLVRGEPLTIQTRINIYECDELGWSPCGDLWLEKDSASWLVAELREIAKQHPEKLTFDEIESIR
jgi:hypothetical protein